jgi:hypothetical protein
MLVAFPRLVHQQEHPVCREGFRSGMVLALPTRQTSHVGLLHHHETFSAGGHSTPGETRRSTALTWKGPNPEGNLCYPRSKNFLSATSS